MTFGSLFSGIGGMDLGLERAGMVCKWQVEIDPFCTKVLQKHWPTVPKYGDITKLDGSELERVDLIAGGFPCQDVSMAGKRTGIAGRRSGLWAEFARLLRVARPRYAIVENVPGLLTAGFGNVIGDLAGLGFDAEWSVLSACSLDAPHTRERVFILAYPEGTQFGLEWWRVIGGQNGTAQRHLHQWQKEPVSRRVADGVPNRVDRYRGCGNAVVPQVAEWIGRRIIEAAA